MRLNINGRPAPSALGVGLCTVLLALLAPASEVARAESPPDSRAYKIGVVDSKEVFKAYEKAKEEYADLEKQVDSLIVIPNDKLTAVMGKSASLKDAFASANEVLYTAVSGISELITVTGLINTDFADVKAIMKDGGAALMTVGRASGEERALAAAEAAITSPLLDINVSGARGVLFNVKGGEDLSLYEVSQAADLIRHTASADANIIFGAVIDEDMRDQIQITLIATGFDLDERAKIRQSSEVETREDARPPESRPPEGRPPSLGDNDLDIPAFLRRKP